MEVRTPFLLPVFDFMALLPYLALAFAGMIGLVIHMVKPKGSSKPLFLCTLMGILIALGAQITQIGHESYLFDMIAKDSAGALGEAVILVSALVVVLISNPYFRLSRIHCPEFFPLICWASIGGMIMCVATNLLVVFVGLELLSISLYVLAGINKRSKFSQEAALKYFLLGAFATGFFLYGIAFLYGTSGTLSFEGFIQLASHGNSPDRPMLMFGFVLILVGFCFKCGVAPFHQWIPDVYAGAPTNVVTFMATGAKVGPFLALFHFLSQAYNLRDFAVPACIGLGIFSMFVGNVMAFTQKDIKKLLAYSSVANAGYIILFLGSLVSANSWRVWPLSYFLIGYVFATMGVFVILALAAKEEEEDHSIDSLRGLSKRHPVMAALLVVFVLSQIGIGPVAGFLGKALLVAEIIHSQLPWIAVIFVANSAFGAFYYFKLVRAAYSDEGEGVSHLSPFEMTSGSKSALAICAIGVIGSVIFYAPLLDFIAQR